MKFIFDIGNVSQFFKQSSRIISNCNIFHLLPVNRESTVITLQSVEKHFKLFTNILLFIKVLRYHSSTLCGKH
jgi:hypothetical protein